MDRADVLGAIATVLVGILLMFALPTYADPFQVMQRIINVNALTGTTW